MSWSHPLFVQLLLNVLSKHNFLTALTQMGASLILICTYQTCLIFINHSSGRL